MIKRLAASANSEQNEEAECPEQIHCLILPYEHRFRTLWDWLIVLITVYLAFTVPYEVTFMSHRRIDWSMQIINGVMEIFFVIYIVLNFRTTYRTSAGVVCDGCSIAIHYMKSWFIIDLVSALPIGLFPVFPMSHQLKTVRLLRLLRLMQKLKEYSHHSVLVLISSIMAFILLAHWAACMWYYIGVSDLQSSHWHNGWLSKLGEQEGTPYNENRTTGGPSEASAYVAALYFTTSCITTVGFRNICPNTNTEKIFSICLMFTGGRQRRHQATSATSAT